VYTNGVDGVGVSVSVAVEVTVAVIVGVEVLVGEGVMVGVGVSVANIALSGLLGPINQAASMIMPIKTNKPAAP
jgi:hypothetical protein